MSYKLTLSVDKSIADFAKEHAKELGVSVTFIVENYFKLLASSKNSINKNKDKEIELSPIVASMVGAFKMPKDFEYKKALNEAKDEKFKEYLNIK